MKKILLAVCSLTNLATDEYVELLSKIPNHSFEVGDLTLLAYGIENASKSDPIAKALYSGILNRLSSDLLPAKAIAELSRAAHVTLDECECIYHFKTTGRIIACDATKTKQALEPHVTASHIITSLDILAEGVRVGKWRVDQAIQARTDIGTRTGMLPANQYDYFNERI